MSIFTSIGGSRRPRKNKFNLSHERKFSFQMGKLTPILVQDVVPGDQFRVKSEIFLRMAPMLAPIMHRVNVYTHYFFVPNRLVWDEWQDFITGGREGTASPVSPYISINDQTKARFQKGLLADFMGVPPVDQETPLQYSAQISALPFRAYQLIYNEYYRDQNLSEELAISKSSGVVTDSQANMLLHMRNRAWEKDYFTSSLPWAQRGGSVGIPFEGEGTPNYKIASVVKGADSLDYDGPLSAEDGLLRTTIGGSTTTPSRIENLDSVDIDGTTVTVNELRRSVRLQEWLEKNARGGARYVEQMLVHFGVKSSDARLQRPEYLGGGKQPVQVSEIVSTFQSPEGTGNPQGNMAGHGVAVGQQNGFKRFFEEHGYVIGLISVLPKTAYQQGLPRHFSRNDRFDYYWPEFANIGEQEVKQKELYFAPNTQSEVLADETFGYQSRYAEYKYQPSTVHGEMRDTLAYWHMGRIFTSRPVLNNSFIESNPDDRIFAVQNAEHMYCQLYNRVDALRPMPYFGTPTL